MKQYFPRYMDGCNDVSWNEIWTEIVRIATKKEITIYSVNGKSKDSLIYKDHEGRTFNVIAIGGDKLSRGLTLEGLTISYFTRGSNTYDTLMQMGRWFGFRPGYLDACRLFTTSDLYGAFSHISMATEDLAEQFEYMDEVDQTPKERKDTLPQKQEVVPVSFAEQEFCIPPALTANDERIHPDTVITIRMNGI